jgi:hypothetical protein
VPKSLAFGLGESIWFAVADAIESARAGRFFVDQETRVG